MLFNIFHLQFLSTLLIFNCSVSGFRRFTCLFHLQVTRLKMSEGGSTARAETQVACMVVVMVMAFLLTWLPYAAFALSVILDPNLYIDPVIATVPMYLAKSSTVFNPIIYIFMNRQVSQYLLDRWISRSWFWGNKTLHILIQIISLLRERGS